MTPRELYERFPYPANDLEVDRLDDLTRALGFLISDQDLAGCRVLDVGCGTGQRLLSMAEYWPETNFVGIDVSQASIRFTEQAIRKSGLTNVHVLECDAFHYVPDGAFDIIVVFGVVHHVNRPLDLLENIRRWLTPRGLVLLWVYHTYGEHQRMQMRSVFQMLLKGGAPEPERLLEALGYSLDLNRYGSLPVKTSALMQIAANMDAFLNPVVIPRKFGETIDLLLEAGFSWAAVHTATSHDKTYLVDTRGPQFFGDLILWAEILNQKDVEFRFRNLGIMDRLQVLELLTEPTGFTTVCGLSSSQFSDRRLIANGRRSVSVR